jgi:TrpR-related protein YerC/YecD
MQIEKIKGHQTDQLFKAVLKLNNLDECYKFFDDLCTISEIQSLAQRFEVAHLLRLKKTYETIKRKQVHLRQLFLVYADVLIMAMTHMMKCWAVFIQTKSPFKHLNKLYFRIYKNEDEGTGQILFSFFLFQALC